MRNVSEKKMAAHLSNISNTYPTYQTSTMSAGVQKSSVPIAAPVQQESKNESPLLYTLLWLWLIVFFVCSVYMIWFRSYGQSAKYSEETKVKLAHVNFGSSIVVYGSIAIFVLYSCMSNPSTCVLLAFFNR